MNKKYYIDDIKKIIEQTEYTIIDDEFTTIKDGVLVCNKDGYKMKINRDNLFKGKSPEIFHKCNPFTIENIKHYISINNIDTILLSEIYKNNTDKLIWKCNCGNIFNRPWNSFYNGAIVCPTCAKNNVIVKQNKEEFELVKQYFSDKNYILCSKEYSSKNKKIDFICNKHKEYGVQNVTWVACKSRGAGCKICAKEKTGMSERLDERKIKQLTENKGFIYDHVEYINDSYHHTYIYFVCPNHKNVGLQKKSLGDMKKSKGGCNYCSGKQRTHEDFVLMMKSINPNIEFITKYKRAMDKIRCKCIIDGFEWENTGNGLLNGVGCPECSKRIFSETKTKTNDEFIEEINKKYNNKIKLLSKYSGVFGKVKCKCNIDFTEWETTATLLLNNSISCPTCRAKATRDRCSKSNDAFIQELLIANPNIEPLEAYAPNKNKIKCRCKIHNFIWNASPDKILYRKTGCPKCASYHNENIINGILDKWGYKYTLQKRFKDCKDKNTLPFDFYLDDFNVLIEYDGEGHYQPIRRGSMTENQALDQLKLVKKHDSIKNIFCKNNNIKLLRIPYWERNNLEYFLFDNFVRMNIITEVA